jgi:hypothetical protein
MNNCHLFAILFYPLSLFADTVVFEKTFGGSGNDFAYSIQQTTDGGYVLAGQTDSFGNGSSSKPDMWIMKIDQMGDKEWERTFGELDNGDGALCVRQTADEGFIVVGTTSSYGKGYPSIWIIKLDSNGDSLWTKIYEGAIVSSAYSVRQTIDGGFIVSGKGEENILKLDENGNKEWGRHYGWIYYSVEQTADGGYIAAGDSIDRQLEWNYIPSISMIKLDGNGNKEWSNPLGNGFLGKINTVQQTAEGGYVIAGDSIDFRSSFEYSHYAMIVKLDENGNREWKYFGDEHSSAQSIQQTADGGYAIAGNATDDGYGLDFIIFKLDENGNEEWMKMYGSSGGWEYASSIQQTSDGGYIVAGQTDSYGAGLYDMWILKLDAEGNGPDPAGIFEIENDSHDGFLLSDCYPNPFNPVTTIEYQLPHDAFVALRIFAVTGELVKTIIEEKQMAGYHHIQWNGRDEDGNSVAGGLYFYHLKAGGFSLSKKMVLVR